MLTDQRAVSTMMVNILSLLWPEAIVIVDIVFSTVRVRDIAPYNSNSDREDNYNQSHETKASTNKISPVFST
jgi:hypothetical protein